jgi:hypothetical protein
MPDVYKGFLLSPSPKILTLKMAAAVVAETLETFHIVRGLFPNAKVKHGILATKIKAH